MAARSCGWRTAGVNLPVATRAYRSKLRLEFRDTVTDLMFANEKAPKGLTIFVASWLCCGLVATLLGCRSSKVGPAPAATIYEAEGSYVLSHFEHGTQTRATRKEFVLSVSNCCWRLTTFDTNNPNWTQNRRTVASLDRGELFEAWYRSHGTTLALVESNSVPSGLDDPGGGHLWLMLASGYFLDRLTTNRLPPLYAHGYSTYFGNDDLTQPVLLDRHERPPRLPERIVYLNEGYWHVRDRQNKLVAYRMKPPFRDGFTNAIFETSDFTNAGSCSLPTRLRFTEYQMETKNGRQTNLTIVNRFEAAVRVVRPNLTVKGFLPELWKRTVFIDRRQAVLHSRQEKGMQYQNFETKGWPSAEESVKDCAAWNWGGPPPSPAPP